MLFHVKTIYVKSLILHLNVDFDKKMSWKNYVISRFEIALDKIVLLYKKL